MEKRVLVVEKSQNWDGSSIYYAYEKSDPSIYEVGESIHQAICFFCMQLGRGMEMKSFCHEVNQNER